MDANELWLKTHSTKVKYLMYLLVIFIIALVGFAYLPVAEGDVGVVVSLGCFLGGLLTFVSLLLALFTDPPQAEKKDGE